MHREAKSRRNTLGISRFFNEAERKICRLNGCEDLFSASLGKKRGKAVSERAWTGARASDGAIGPRDQPKS